MKTFQLATALALVGSAGADTHRPHIGTGLCGHVTGGALPPSALTVIVAGPPNGNTSYVQFTMAPPFGNNEADIFSGRDQVTWNKITKGGIDGWKIDAVKSGTGGGEGYGIFMPNDMSWVEGAGFQWGSTTSCSFAFETHQPKIKDRQQEMPKRRKTKLRGGGLLPLLLPCPMYYNPIHHTLIHKLILFVP